jgi:hypothetical protein
VAAKAAKRLMKSSGSSNGKSKKTIDDENQRLKMGATLREAFDGIKPRWRRVDDPVKW